MAIVSFIFSITVNAQTEVNYPAEWGHVYQVYEIPVPGKGWEIEPYLMVYTEKGVGFIGKTQKDQHFFDRSFKDPKTGEPILSRCFINGAFINTANGELIPAHCTVVAGVGTVGLIWNDARTGDPFRGMRGAVLPCEIIDAISNYKWYGVAAMNRLQ